MTPNINIKPEETNHALTCHADIARHGPADGIGRTVAEQWEREIGQPVVINLRPVSVLFCGPGVLRVNKNSRFNTLQDQVKEAKANFGKLWGTKHDDLFTSEVWDQHCK